MLPKKEPGLGVRVDIDVRCERDIGYVFGASRPMPSPPHGSQRSAPGSVPGECPSSGEAGKSPARDCVRSRVVPYTV